ncbi:MAG: DUF3179 domain-containing protein [Chloroflexi bacterium]|nr:DUF3179 domain-containing protein [Chloroflexota bacterium]
MRFLLLVLVIVLVSVGVACGGGQGPQPTLPPTPTPPVLSTGSPKAGETEATDEGGLSQDEIEALMYRLIYCRKEFSDTSGQLIALGAIEASNDLSFVPVLVELIQVPLTRDELLFNDSEVIPVLERITGQSFGYDGKAWVEWLVGQPDIMLPDAYLQWKVDILSQVDSRFRDYFVDKETGQLYPREKIRLELPLVVWGGVSQDDGSGLSIPALVNAPMTDAVEARYIKDSDRVFGISINGDSRAYPLMIMNWHELANDVVGGVPVALAYCTLCGSGILFDSSVDGTTYTFRTSGLLYKSNKLMYDLDTSTLWNQFTGEPAIGELADSGITLKALPITLTTWGDWLDGHPETKVLSISTGYFRSYVSEGTQGAAYNDYFSDPELWFPLSDQDDRLGPKTVVFGLAIDGDARAYPTERMKLAPVVNETVGGTGVVLVTNPTTGAVRAYERQGLSFLEVVGGEGEELLKDDSGGEWRIEESALVGTGDSGLRLDRIVGRTAFWFAWRSFHPETLIYGEDG